ncbi:MAG: hypothetical protein Q4F53_06335 [Nesterenkonia sp.]|uniref:hypothetical protein n=1 Tax=Nesterenkonia marinintestina TaxID=2979865 RepID=UPI0021C1C4BF|nr:hypothetical protein [Nesterenkonia sp. GX14115]MDO5493217.1 hypothetical protein [Nesterenkonia sp.]
MPETTCSAETAPEAAPEAAPHPAVRRTVGALTAGLLAFTLTACERPEDSDEDQEDQQSEETESAQDEEQEDEQDAEEAAGGDEPIEDQDVEDPEEEDTEAADDPTQLEVFESSPGPMSFEGVEEGGVTGPEADTYATDAPDPAADTAGSSSAEFRDSVYEARERGEFQRGTVSGVSVEDEEMDNGVEITRVIRDFPSPRKSGLLSYGGEIVLLFVEPTRDSDRYPMMHKLFFLGPEGEERRNTLLLDSEMERADLVPYDGSSEDPSAGWIAFVVEERADEYELGIVRPEIDVPDSDEMLDKKVWEFSLRAE